MGNLSIQKNMGIEIVQELPIDKIERDINQPRRHFKETEIVNLANSIREYSLLQPIIVRPIADSRWMIVLGEMRFRAHIRLGCKTIKAIVRNFTGDEARDRQLVENIQRNDLTDIELAWEFAKRVNDDQTHEEIARIIGKNRTFVTQRLSLLRLSEKDQQRMLKGELGFSQARALVSVKDPEERERISDRISKDMSVQKVQRLIEEKATVSNVPHVTPRPLPRRENVNVRKLAVWETIHSDSGDLRESVPRAELIQAYIKDLKVLRGR